MAARGPNGEDVAAAECVPERPHFESVWGTCSHDESQSLVTYFAANSGGTYPIYDVFEGK